MTRVNNLSRLITRRPMLTRAAMSMSQSRTGAEMALPTLSSKLTQTLKLTLKLSSGGAAVVAAVAVLGITATGEVKADAAIQAGEETNKELSTEDSDVHPLRDTEARYLAYARRIKVAIVSSTRYIAYSSDIGESLRPIVEPWWVKALYGVSFAYVAADVAYTGYLETERGSSNTILVRSCLHALLFQSIASIMVPSLIIHTAVHQAEKLVNSMKSAPGPLRKYGPSIFGLCLVPLLPVTVDHPVEWVVDNAYDLAWPPPPGYVPLHGGHDPLNDEIHEEANNDDASPIASIASVAPQTGAHPSQSSSHSQSLAAASTSAAAASASEAAAGAGMSDAQRVAALQARLVHLRDMEAGINSTGGSKTKDDVRMLREIEQEKKRTKMEIKQH